MTRLGQNVEVLFFLVLRLHLRLRVLKMGFCVENGDTLRGVPQTAHKWNLKEENRIIFTAHKWILKEECRIIFLVFKTEQNNFDACKRVSPNERVLLCTR